MGKEMIKYKENSHSEPWQGQWLTWKKNGGLPPVFYVPKVSFPYKVEALILIFKRLDEKYNDNFSHLFRELEKCFN